LEILFIRRKLNRSPERKDLGDVATGSLMCRSVLKPDTVQRW